MYWLLGEYGGFIIPDDGRWGEAREWLEAGGGPGSMVKKGGGPFFTVDGAVNDDSWCLGTMLSVAVERVGTRSTRNGNPLAIHRFVKESWCIYDTANDAEQLRS